MTLIFDSLMRVTAVTLRAIMSSIFSISASTSGATEPDGRADNFRFVRHFEGGQEYDQAISYLILATENAARRFAYRDSIELLRPALGLVAKLSSSLGDELETRILEFMGDAH